MVLALRVFPCGCGNASEVIEHELGNFISCSVDDNERHRQVPGMTRCIPIHNSAEGFVSKGILERGGCNWITTLQIEPVRASRQSLGITWFESLQVDTIWKNVFIMPEEEWLWHEQNKILPKHRLYIIPLEVSHSNLYTKKNALAWPISDMCDAWHVEL